MRFGIIILAGLPAFLALPAMATTWHVATDGTGDFAVIQEAVDAAADGDVIQIAPGRYDQYRIVSGNNIYVDILGKELNLIGSGAEVTFIGPADPETHPIGGYPTYIVYGREAGGLTLENLTIENGSQFQILSYADRFTMDGCVVRGNGEGVVLHGADGGTVRDSHFAVARHYGRDSIAAGMGAGEILIEGCRMEGGGTGVFVDGSAAGAVIRNCHFDGCMNGCGFNSGSSGSVTGCQFTDIDNKAIIVGSGPMTITDNVIDLSSGCGIYLVSDGPADIRQNIIRVEDGICVFVYWAPQIVFHENHLFRAGALGPQAGGIFVKTPDYWPFAPVTWDLSNNYWATTDPEEIATYIIDGNDLEGIEVFINFLPLADGPVTTRRSTMGGIKALYR